MRTSQQGQSAAAAGPRPRNPCEQRRSKEDEGAPTARAGKPPPKYLPMAQHSGPNGLVDIFWSGKPTENAQIKYLPIEATAKISANGEKSRQGRQKFWTDGKGNQDSQRQREYPWRNAHLGSSNVHNGAGWASGHGQHFETRKGPRSDKVGSLKMWVRRQTCLSCPLPPTFPTTRSPLPS